MSTSVMRDTGTEPKLGWDLVLLSIYIQYIINTQKWAISYLKARFLGLCIKLCYKLGYFTSSDMNYNNLCYFHTILMKSDSVSGGLWERKHCQTQIIHF